MPEANIVLSYELAIELYHFAVEHIFKVSVILIKYSNLAGLSSFALVVM